MTCLHIAIYVPGLPFNSKTLSESSLGGSETAGLQMARALRDLGHRIYLFCNCEFPHEDNRIEFIPLDKFQHFMTFIQHDVCIIQRAPEIIRNRSQAKLSLLWLHDMTLLRHHDSFVASMWNTDKVMLLSKYHIEQYRQVHGENILPDEVIYRTRNGIDTSLFPHLAGDGIPDIKKRDKKTLVYAARPERGLDHLLGKIMPALIQHDPEIKLLICGYDNAAPQLESFYQHCRMLAAKLGPNVVHAGALPKHRLYQMYSHAGIYVYPTPSPSNPRFREISCITMMECMASGLPVVATASGALPETLHRDAGILIDGLPGEEAHDSAFVSAVIDLIDNPESYEKASLAGCRKAKSMSWNALAQEWSDYFIYHIELKSENAVRLARHFERTGDHIAACEVMGAGDAPIPEFRRPEMASPEQAAVIHSWIDKLGSKYILDFGQLQRIHHLKPDVVFHGIPLDDLYDAVVLVNDLEYQENPQERIAEAASYLADGGHVLICTPFGPHQIDRLWNFEAADFEDMIGHMPKFDLFANVAGTNPETSDPIGFTFAKFQLDRSKKVRFIDLNRKLTIQSPRQTLAVNIIAGGPLASDNLHWCLKSVSKIADEIIIADTGMDEEAIRIASQYPVKIIPHAANPLEVGFDVPRNQALEASTSDWILWMDTDERLIGAEYLTKYLRNNIFDGYGIKQHHFGIGISHEPDMPVRLFRRDGKIRFYGRIHEHPEKEINEGPGLVVVLSDVAIMHIGYESERVRAARFARNKPLLEMDRRDYPERILQKHMIMRDNMILAANELAANGNQANDYIISLCEETIDLWRKHFKGGCKLVGLDSLQYYTRACQILGIGVDVAFRIEAGRDGYGANIDGHGMRFANEDDLMSEIKLQAERKYGQYLKEYF